MATRDMTKAQFYAALDRNGFNRPTLWWVSSKDDDSISYGMIFDRTGKLMRRATLAHVIYSRDERQRKAA